MIVGRKVVELTELESRIKDKQSFINYSNSLIDPPFRHRRDIQHNQLYLCCLILRTSRLLDWKVKKTFISEILKDVKVTGYVNEMTETRHLISIMNKQRLFKIWRSENEVK